MTKKDKQDLLLCMATEARMNIIATVDFLEDWLDKCPTDDEAQFIAWLHQLKILTDAVNACIDYELARYTAKNLKAIYEVREPQNKSNEGRKAET